MEISLQDIYALSHADRAAPRTEGLPEHLEPPPRVKSSKATKASSPPASIPAPPPGAAPTVELDEDLIELDDVALDEITSEVFDERDYDLVQQNFFEIDDNVDPALHEEDSSQADDGELSHTGVLERSYEELLLEQSLVDFSEASELAFPDEEDTDPSLDVLLRSDLDAAATTSQAFDPSEVFDSMEEISEVQFAHDAAEPQESWVDSTSVFSPNAALLEAARGVLQDAPDAEERTRHMIEVPILEMLDGPIPLEDATGLFEVPSSLLSQLRSTPSVPQIGLTAPELPQDDQEEDLTVQRHVSSLEPVTVSATVDGQGHLVIDRDHPLAYMLRPGQRLNVTVQILSDPSE